MNGLLRHVNPVAGPITGIESSIQPGIFKPLYWYSQAKLSASVQETFGGRFPVPVTGTGWARDKEQSQAQAIGDALARLAHNMYREHPTAGGMKYDSGLTGFVAASTTDQMGRRGLVRRALHAAAARWALGQMHLDGTLIFEEPSMSPYPNLKKLFSGKPGRLRFFHAMLELPGIDVLPREHASFVVAIFELEAEGIIPGAACGTTVAEATERAALEAYNNLRRFERTRSGQEQLLDRLWQQRLWRWATERKLGQALVRRLAQKGADHFWPNSPSVQYAAALPGPWLPEAEVFRVVLRHSQPVEEGGLDRFVW